jgi:hypothetical protein
MKKYGVGRPRVDEDRKRKRITLTLAPDEIEALQRLSEISRDSYGATAGKLFLREIEREQKKARKDST